MKFLILLKKELRDLANTQVMITFGLMFAMLFVISGFTGNIAREAASAKSDALAILDLDKSSLSAEIISSFEREGAKINLIDEESQAENYIVIQSGFEEGVLAGRPQTVKRVSTLKSLSIMEAAKLAGNAEIEKINGYVARYFAENQYGIGNNAMLTNPVAAQPVTVVNGKSADISPGDLAGALMSSSVFVPVIIMMLTLFSAQMIGMAVTAEKTDKTLETLMSMPVSKMEILFSKIISSGIVAAVVASISTLVLSGSSLVGSGVQSGLGATLSKLGLALGPAQYALLGADILLTVAISLCFAFILTIISPEAKSSQLTSYPLVLLTIIPYILTILVDINSLPALPRLLVYLIPFSHTFAATSNILLGNMTPYFLGLGYQLAFLCATVFLTIKIFSSDVIFTGVRLKRRRNKKLNSD